MAYKENFGVSTNVKLIEMYNRMKSGELVLHPEFQRNLVWNDAHKENFIETILKGYPFPEVYLADGELDMVTLKSKTLVVDGQQRLSTIYSYIENDDKLKLKKIKSFDQLTETEREDFLYYNIVIRDLKNISKSEIKEVFKRINSVSYALNAMEIDNALYDGEFITTAQEIATVMSSSRFPFFSGSDEIRMKDVEFILTVMTTIEIGAFFTGRKEVKEMIQRYDNEYPNKEKMKEDFLKAISLIEKINIRFDSIWYSKSGKFTLLTELITRLYKGYCLPDIEKLNEILVLVDEEVHKEEPIEKYAQFYYYCCQGTGSKQGRTIRGELLNALLE
ncbi:MAG: DUF262 domain-containing protein [Agathobacter sp.]|nr:DUF262 domain-containing protein [Agathobacter sp.]